MPPSPPPPGRTGAATRPPEPALTERGGALVVCGVLLIFIGSTAGAPFLAVSGATLLALASLALGRGRQRAVELAQLQLEWGAEPPPMRPRGTAVPLALEAGFPGARSLRGLSLEPVVSGPVDLLPTPQVVDAPPHAKTRLTFPLTPPRAGLWHVWGVRLSLTDGLGLARIEQYRPLPLMFHAAPRPLPPHVAQRLLSRMGAVRDREGRHLDRQSGSGLELRELRDYIPGDPLKAVAWKASARRGRWLVRAYEDESVRRFQILLAIGPTMRLGSAGDTPLDRALDFAAHLVEHAAGERIGITTYDHRIHAHLKPDTGRPHTQRLLQQLLDVTRVVDEDFTEISDAELHARIGELLERHAGHLLRRIPEDPARIAQPELMMDPLREMYDEAALFTQVSEALRSERERGRALLHAKSRPAADLTAARLRVFCGLNAIPLPYRRSGAPDAAEVGLSQAVARSLLPGGAETLTLISDFAGLAPDGPGLRTLRLCRAHKRHLVIVPLGPLPPDPVWQALLATGARIADVLEVRPPPVAPTPGRSTLPVLMKPQPAHG